MHSLEKRIQRLQRAFPHLAEELRHAFRYVASDAAGSLNKSRSVLEKLLRTVYQTEMGREPRKLRLGDMLADNQFTRLLDRRICSRMHAVRDMGNLGAHGEHVESSDAQRVLDDLGEILEWYRQRYPADAVAESDPEGDGLPPVEPGAANGADGSRPGEAVGVQTGTASIEIVVDRDFDTFTAEDQQRLLRALGELLGVAGTIQVTRKRRGSVRLTLRLTPEQAERLLWTVKMGGLADLGVVDAQLLDPDFITRTPEAQAPEPALDVRTSELPSGDAEAPRAAGAVLPVVPGYEPLRLLALGARGEVWLARSRTTGAVVAVKFFTGRGDLSLRRADEEALQLARLQQPGVVRLIEIGDAAGQPYFVLEFAEGGSLDTRLAHGPLPVGEAVEVFRQVTDTLARLHAAGLVHGDLKPANVLLDAQGRPLLADFGTARLQVAAPALGTFFYMAPEQARVNQSIPDPRWDVYALGALLHALLTGRAPHADSQLRGELAGTMDLSGRLERYRDGVCAAPRPGGHRRVPGVDRSLARIIDRCLEIEPAKRFRDASAVLEALERRDRRRRRRPLWLLAVVALLLVLLALAWAVLS